MKSHSKLKTPKEMANDYFMGPGEGSDPAGDGFEAGVIADRAAIYEALPADIYPEDETGFAESALDWREGHDAVLAAVREMLEVKP